MKTIIAKKALTLLGFVVLFINLFAQTDSEKKKKMCDELMKNSYIFEGKVISSKQGIRMKGRNNKYYNFNSYLIQVNKVIKGNINKGTVEIMTGIAGIGFEDNGKIDHYRNSDGGQGGTPPPSEGIYFCYREIPIIDSNTNSKSLEFYFASSLFNGELKKDNYGNLITYFPTIKEFYAYISANYGVKIEQ